MKHKLIQMIMVREENDPAPEGVEYKHGLTPPMRDARRRRFRREPDLNVIKSIALQFCSLCQFMFMDLFRQNPDSFLLNFAGEAG